MCPILYTLFKSSEPGFSNKGSNPPSESPRYREIFQGRFPLWVLWVLLDRETREVPSSCALPLPARVAIKVDTVLLKFAFVPATFTKVKALLLSKIHRRLTCTHPTSNRYLGRVKPPTQPPEIQSSRAPFRAGTEVVSV
jgi:hypothetical protein